MTQTTPSPADSALERARKRVEDLRGFYTHLMVYLVVNGGLVLLDLALGDEWWFYWVAIPWGIGLAAHGVSIFAGRFFDSDWEQRKIESYLHEDRPHGR